MSSDMSNIILLLSVVFTIAGMVAGVFFLLTLQRALALCAPQNRTLSPGKVWLCFIPLFNFVWLFIVVSRVSRSLEREFESRQGPPGDYGRNIGLAYCILAVTSVIPFVGVLTGLASTVCWIVYWVGISGYSRTLRDGGRVPQDDAHVEEPFNPGRAWLVFLVLIFAYAAQHLQTLNLSWFLPALRTDLGLTSHSIGLVITAFVVGLTAGYALLLLVTSLCGTRWGLAVALAGVSLASVGSGMASGANSMMAARAVLGFFAGGILPAAIQSLRESFPASLRPLAIGLFLAGGPLVALAASPLLPHLTKAVAWRQAFMLFGIPTAIAAVLCWVVVRPPARIAASSGVTGVGVVSVVMLGLGALLAAPLFTFVESFAPIVMRNVGTTFATLSIVNAAASVAGPILAGVAGWAMIATGMRPWKSRAALLTLFGLILPVCGFYGIFASGWIVVGVSALVMGAFQGWSTLLYTAVADTLPVRGVAIGVAIGSIILELALTLSIYLLEGVQNGYGTRVSFGMPAALAAAGFICIVLLAWLVHPGTAGLPAPSVEAASGSPESAVS